MTTCLGKSTIGITQKPQERDGLVSSYDKRLDDCVLSCNDRVRIPANTFAMVTTCSVLAMFFDEMPDRGERTFYVDAPSALVQTLVDIIHAKRHVNELEDVTHIADLLHLMDYLGCTYKWRKIVQRLWAVLRTQPLDAAGPVLMEHAQLLLPEFRSGYLHKLRLMYPHWSDFSKVFDHMVITGRLAVVLIETLTRFFPVCVLVDAIRQHAPESHRNDIVHVVLSIRRLGAMFHPDELAWTMRRLPCMPIVDCVRDAFTVVNRPCGSKIPSSMLTYPTRNMASFFFVLDDVSSRKRTTVSFPEKVANFVIDPSNGSVAIGVNMDKLGSETASVALTAYVRATVFDDVVCPAGRAIDQWKDVEIDENGMWSVRFDDVILNGPDWLKIDVFWLHDPRIC